MEMHQVRYFLATVSELNFTKAAEKCNVTQPSLTRAIKQLEDELGGDLFRRERPQAQLTELGQRMHPLLKQCYESALGARSLAAAIQSGEVGALKLALSRTINLELLTPHLTELIRLFNRLEVKLLRGTAPQVVEFLKAGDAELAVAGDIGEEWERLDRWPLFTEEFGLIFNARHRLAAHPMIEIEDLRQERWLRRAYCEQAEQTAALIRGHHLDVDQRPRAHIRARPHHFAGGRPGRRVRSAHRAASRDLEARARQRRRIASHRLSLRRRRPPAHADGIGHPEDAARGGLVALHGLIAAGERRFGAALERIPIGSNWDALQIPWFCACPYRKTGSHFSGTCASS